MKKRSDVSPKAGVKQYGNVTFADPVNKKYPLDTEAHIRSAWSYIGMPKNAAKYPPKDVKAIKSRIVAAWKKKVDKAGPPAAAPAKEAVAYYRSLYLLREHATRRNVDDLTWAVRQLREAAQPIDDQMREKRAEVIAQLNQKADAVEATHDPQIVADLLTALRAFLSEELDEQNSEEDSGMAKKGEEEARREEARRAAEEDGFMKYAGGDPDEPDADDVGQEQDEEEEALRERRRAAAEEDGFAKYLPAAPGQPGQDDDEEEEEEEEDTEEEAKAVCPACGEAMTAPPAMEEARKKAEEKRKEESDKRKLAVNARKEAEKKMAATQTKLTESEALIVSLRQQLRAKGTNQLTEAERTELTALRVEKRSREHAARALEAIKKANAEGVIEVGDLTPLKESQWPVIIKALMRDAGPPQGFGAGERGAPAPAAPKRNMTAVDAFNAAFESVR